MAAVTQIKPETVETFAKPFKDRFLRQKEVTHLTGIPRPTLYYMISLNKFPAQISLCDGGKSVAWLESDVLAWMNKRVAASKAA